MAGCPEGCRGSSKNGRVLVYPGCCCPPRCYIINDFASIPCLPKLSFLLFYRECLAEGFLQLVWCQILQKVKRQQICSHETCYTIHYVFLPN
nr:hypothetical protein Iba_chr14aCG20440 [Ipomoea batatas]